MGSNQNRDSVVKAIGVNIPAFYVDVDELLVHYGKSPEEIKKLKHNILGPHESITAADTSYMDTVVLALNAFHEQEETMNRLGMPRDYSRIGMIRGGTENPPDTSKSTMALMIQEHFGMHSNMSTGSGSAACAVGWNLWSDAINFTLANQDHGLEAIVAMADIARYDPYCKKAENKLVTAGAGSVTLWQAIADLDKDQWLMRSLGLEGYFSQSFQDFWVPTGSIHPNVNGLVSCWCYDLGIMGALQDHFRKLDKKQGHKSIQERLSEYDVLVMHAPFWKQVEDAFYLSVSGKTNEKMEFLEHKINQQLADPKNRQYLNSVTAMIAQARQEAPWAEEEFERLTRHWRELPLQIGNSYSASVFISLMYGLQKMGQESEISENKRINVLMLTFGSGLTAAGVSLEIHPYALEYAQELDVAGMVKARKRVDDIELYKQQLIKNNTMPLAIPAVGHFKISRIKNGYPSYSKIPEPHILRTS